MSRPRPVLLFVVNADWFFVSHRLQLAQACQRAGYEVHLCAGESEARQVVERAGVIFHPLSIDRGGTHPFHEAATIRSLFEVHRAVRPDIVHHVTIKPVLYGGLIARALAVPAVHSVSGLGYVFIQNAHDHPAKRVLRAGLERLYRLVFSEPRSRVVFQNPTDRAHFVDRGLVPLERTRLVAGSGVDAERFAECPLPPLDAPLVLLPARLLYDKGVGEFVAAARALRARHPTWRFVLAGRIDPGNPARIDEATVRSWVAEGTVEWWSDRGPLDMPGAYAAAALVVLPSYREGLPLAVAEAQCVGRAVVTADVPGCRDAIVDGETGWLVPARDTASLESTMERAILEVDELKRRSQNAAKFACATFAQRRIFEELLSIYSELGVPGAASTLAT